MPHYAIFLIKNKKLYCMFVLFSVNLSFIFLYVCAHAVHICCPGRKEKERCLSREGSVGYDTNSEWITNIYIYIHKIRHVLLCLSSLYVLENCACSSNLPSHVSFDTNVVLSKEK